MFVVKNIFKNLPRIINLKHFFAQFFFGLLVVFLISLFMQSSLAAVTVDKSFQQQLKEITEKNPKKTSETLIFDFPVTYNPEVSHWISYFQTKGAKWFREILERSTKFLPLLQTELKYAGLPQDLSYMVMVESGFSSQAHSVAEAVGPWQFIEPTGNRFGLSRTWWLDERKDFMKSTRAAIKYLKELNHEFGSWELVVASYNMGENGLRKIIQKNKTKDYWSLVKKKALPAETQEYVPKILAAMIISKAPSLYGFRNYEKFDPLDYEVVTAPGGVDLNELADHLSITRKSLKDLNAELILNYIPKQVSKHPIRVPRGARDLALAYFEKPNVLKK